MFHCAKEDGEAPDRGELIWNFKTGGSVNSSPVFRKNEVIIGSDDGYLYGINSSTGLLNWKYKTNGPVKSTALIRDDLVYFGSMDNQFYCIQILNHSNNPILRWNFTANNGIISSAHYYNKSIYFGDLSGYLYRVEDGVLHWKIKISRKEIWSSPIIDSSSGYVYITDIGNRWVTIRIDEGTQKRLVGLSNVTNFYCSGVLDLETLFILGGNDKKLHAEGTSTSMSSNNYRWGFYIGESAYSNPVIHDNRIIFNSINYTWCLPLKYYDDDHTVYKNEVIWTANTNDSKGGSSPLVAGGMVFSGSGDGNLYCFDEINGEKKWSFSTDGPIVSSPALYDKHIYFGTQNGSIYCIGEKPIEMQILTESNISLTVSNETKKILVDIKDVFGNPLEKAVIIVNITLGHVLDHSGSQTNKFITNDYGVVVFYYLPPNISFPTNDTIIIECIKEGYVDRNTTIAINLIPQNSPDDIDDDEMNKKNEDFRFIFMIFSSIIILLSIFGFILFGILKKTRSNKKY